MNNIKSYESFKGPIENPKAQAYLNHLLNDGSNEEDSGYELTLPPYYNEELFKKGQIYFKKYRFIIQSSLMVGLVGILAIPSITKIIQCTSKPASSAKAYKRVIRTIMHITSWYENSPDDKSSKLWLSLKAVRNTHSRSSRFCQKLGAGRITQKDMAITQFGFMGFLTLGLERIQQDDIEFFESFTHMWRVFGYLLGMKDEYNIFGENWSESKLRLEIVMHQVIQPALEKPYKEFDHLCNLLFEGVWTIDIGLTKNSFLYMTKRLANVRGYEYFESDYPLGIQSDTKQHRYYKDLNLLDRIIVFCDLILMTYLYKYAFVRWCLNLRMWFTEQLFIYLPYLASLKFGLNWSYTRVFNDDNKLVIDYSN